MGMASWTLEEDAMAWVPGWLLVRREESFGCACHGGRIAVCS